MTSNTDNPYHMRIQEIWITLVQAIKIPTQSSNQYITNRTLKDCFLSIMRGSAFVVFLKYERVRMLATNIQIRASLIESFSLSNKVSCVEMRVRFLN